MTVRDLMDRLMSGIQSGELRGSGAGGHPGRGQ